MPLKAKHIVEELNGQRCTVVEKNIPAGRMEFLRNLLAFNQFEVIVVEDKKEDDSENTFTIGVTDLVFNPVIAVYELILKTPNGQKVSPAYWDQTVDKGIDQYWLKESYEG
jgi:uncharacterized UPF0146 family protein